MSRSFGQRAEKIGIILAIPAGKKNHRAKNISCTIAIYSVSTFTITIVHLRYSIPSRELFVSLGESIVGIILTAKLLSARRMNLRSNTLSKVIDLFAAQIIFGYTESSKMLVK